MISARQIRAARALLNWNQAQLAEMSGIARTSIKNIENQITAPRVDTAAALKEAFENHGVEFLPGDGVRIRDATVMVLTGKQGLITLFDDVYETAVTDKRDILIANNEEPLDIEEDVLAYLKTHLERLEKAGVKERILCREGDQQFLAAWQAYRWMPEKNHSNTPTLVYGDKLALMIWGPPSKVTIIHDPQYAESFRNLFEFAWDRAIVPEVRK